MTIMMFRFIVACRIVNIWLRCCRDSKKSESNIHESRKSSSDDNVSSVSSSSDDDITSDDDGNGNDNDVGYI